MAIAREDVLSAIRESELLDEVAGLRDDVKLTEQGIDSLGMFSLLLALSERHGIEVPDADAEKLHTIGQIVAYFNQREG